MRLSVKYFIFTLILIMAYLILPSLAYCWKVYIPQGTEIPAKYKLTLTTELKNKPAENEVFEITSNQKISGIGVIRQGDKVFCEIIKFKKPGFLGGAGAIEVRIDSIKTALGRNIQIETKTIKSKGKNKRLKALLMLPVLGYGFLIKGEHAELGKQNDTIILRTSKLEVISF